MLAFALPQAFHNVSSVGVTVSYFNWINPKNFPKVIEQSKDYKTWLKDMGNSPPSWFVEINVDENEKTL